MIFALLIDSLELPIISSHSCGQLKATRITVEDSEIIFRIFRFVVTLNKFLHNLNHSGVNIFVIGFIQIELSDAVHCGLTRNEIKEVVTLGFSPCFYGKCEIKLNDNAIKEIVISSTSP